MDGGIGNEGDRSVERSQWAGDRGGHLYGYCAGWDVDPSKLQKFYFGIIVETSNRDKALDIIEARIGYDEAYNDDFYTMSDWNELSGAYYISAIDFDSLAKALGYMKIND